MCKPIDLKWHTSHAHRDFVRYHDLDCPQPPFFIEMSGASAAHPMPPATAGAALKLIFIVCVPH
jgi:hypothetical protein